MARYRKVDPRLWDDERFVDFDDLKRSLWLLLLTGPAVEPIPGLQIGGIASLAETLRRPVEPLRERLGELLGERLVEVDERLRLIRLPNALKYNEPDNPNQVTGWFKAWQSMPESRLKYDHIDSIREACEASDNRKNDGKTSCLERFEKTFGTVRVTVPPTVPVTVPPTVGVSRARSEQDLDLDLDIPPGGADAPAHDLGTGESSQVLTLIPDDKPKRPRTRQLSIKQLTPRGLCWKVWREMYQSSRRKYGKYVENPASAKAIEVLAQRALSEAISELTDRCQPGANPEPMVEEILRHWFANFLRDDGFNDFLATKRHAVEYLLKSLSEYGLPKGWGQSAKQNAMSALASVGGNFE